MSERQRITKLHQNSRTMCNLEDMFFSSLRIGDWASMLHTVHAFLAMARS